MAPPRNRNWIQGAIKHPGAFSAQAKRAGMSTRAFAQAHKGDTGVTGRRARFALTLMAMGKKKKSKGRSEEIGEKGESAAAERREPGGG